ncbi:hypothetical protein CO662_22025 [Rhizobium anhuiense]|uniref:Uncharacterized protein n=1 Tax=Rhizobium anhuiense TaxID=1184720 RepID=A0ABX4J3V9_9HYPH|nr:hypothetical protein CO662_22025 [Rhizobium anhuiense]
MRIASACGFRNGFNRWGRIFAESEERREARAFCAGYMFDWADAYDEPVRRWMDRLREPPEIGHSVVA